MSYSEDFKKDKIEKMREPEKEKAIPPDPYSEENFGNWQSDVEAALDMFSLKNTYYSETWLYIVVNLVARKISSRPMTIYKEILKDGTLTTEPAEGIGLLKMLDNPNDYEGYTNFMYRLASELTLMGNAIVWRLKFHRQLMLIPTEICTIEVDPKGRIKWYNVNFGVAREFQDIFDGYIKIFPQDVMHIRLPNLNSIFWGLSPFMPGRKSVLYDKYTKEFLLNFYLRQANPGPVLELGELANEKNAIKLLKSAELSWSGRRNARRTMILPKGVTAKVLQQTMAEQQLTEHLKINRDDIRALLAIPPHELGLQQSGSIGSKETSEQIKNFWEQTILPFQNLISDSFTHFFQKELGPRTFFGFDNTGVGALQEDESEKADIAIKQLNFKTLNEIREELYALPPVPGGDLIRGSQQALPGVFSMPDPRQTAQLETPAIPEAQEEEETSSEPLLKRFPEWWGKRKEIEDRGTDAAENRVLKNVLAIFEDQAEFAVKEFKKVYKDRLKQEGFFPEEERLKTALNEAFLDYETVYVNATLPTLQATSELGYDLQLTTPFNLPSVDEIEALRATNAEGRRATMEARAIENFETFTQTTTNDILKTVERGVLASKSIDDIAKDIVAYFGEAAPNRSKTIARTETLLAVSLGQKAAEEDAATLIPGMKKMWITAGDSRVRSFADGDATDHAQLDGKQVEVGKSWKTPAGNNLEFPRDPRGPANETINCRCNWILIPPEGLDDDLTLPQRT